MTPERGPSVQEQLEGIGERDEAAEFRIFGPPGCGKTTSLARQIKRAVEKYGPDSVLVTSFSRAAASELVGRNLPIERNQVGTLHAHCFRALGRPPIAETKVADWNQTYPHYAITGNNEGDLDESAADRTARAGNGGDDLLAEASRRRNQLMPLDHWPDQRAVAFYKRWREWKESNGLLDFTDLLEHAANNIHFAPGHPRVIFGDEAQDFTPLQLEIIRQWGDYADYFVIVGDDDQTIYEFTGATPEAFIRPEVAQDRKIILSQSYRVPKAVHGLALDWIGHVSQREPKEYRPTANEGSVHVMDRADNFNRPDRILNDAERRIAKGQTCMFLAACGYMLDPLRRQLIERGIPFHNPYRRTRGDWNPLRGSAKHLSAADRVVALLQPHSVMGGDARPWTAREFKAFAEWMAAQGTFQRGVKTALKTLADDDEVSEEQLAAWFTPEQFEGLSGLLDGPARSFLEWWLHRVQDAHKKTAGFPCRIAALRGIDALRETPRVILGTIHSVKGGEADVVYLFPDLSAAGDAQWSSRSALLRDSIYRQFYVGMTRARDTLVICGPASDRAVRIA